MSWKSKDLLTLEELSAAEITHILDTASSFKEVSDPVGEKGAGPAGPDGGVILPRTFHPYPHLL